MSFYQKYIAQCNKKGVSPSRAAQDIGLKNSSVTGWKNGSIPTDATKAKLEEYFWVEPGYFSEETEKAPTLSGGGSVDMILDGMSNAELIEIISKATERLKNQ